MSVSRIAGLYLFLALVLAAGQFCCPSASALDEAPAADVDADKVLRARIERIDDLSSEILRDVIDMQKFNLNYRLNAVKQGRWKGWRFFFFQETGLALTEAATIKTVEYRGRHLHRPSANRKAVIANGTYVPAMVGGVASASGDMLELAINLYHHGQAMRRGYSPTQARKHVAGLLAKVDRDIAEREALIAASRPAGSATAQLEFAEGQVLKDIRDSSIEEFNRYRTDAREIFARQNSFYIADAAQRAVFLVANGLSINSALKSKPRMNGSIGVLNTAGGAMIMANPLFSQGVGRLARWWDTRTLRASGLAVPNGRRNMLKSDYEEMNRLAELAGGDGETASDSLLRRMEIYERDNSFYTTQVQRNAAAIRRGNRTAIQNVNMGLLVGGARLPAGILRLYEADKHDHSRLKSQPPMVKNSRITNENRYTAAVVYLPVASVALLDSWRIRLGGELEYQRQKRRHALPEQLLRARLAELDAMKSQL